MRQNWNNLISFIKYKVGAPMNYFEFSDEDLRNMIAEHVLPALSQHVGRPMWIPLSKTDIIDDPRFIDPSIKYEMYKIPVPENILLIDVQYVYFNRDNMGVMGIYQNMLTVMDPRDTVMTNEFLGMLNSMEAVQAFHFVPPDKIHFDRPLLGNRIILECKVEHEDLSTIPSDVYHEFLKPWALAEVYENVAAIRKKYRTVNTPFGTIEMDADDFENKAQVIKQTIQEKLDALPPDHLLEIFQ